MAEIRKLTNPSPEFAEEDGLTLDEDGKTEFEGYVTKVSVTLDITIFMPHDWDTDKTIEGSVYKTVDKLRETKGLPLMVPHNKDADDWERVENIELYEINWNEGWLGGRHGPRDEKGELL